MPTTKKPAFIPDQKILSPEQITPGVKYTFTLCPSDHNQYWEHNEVQRVTKSIEQIETGVIVPLFRRDECFS